LSDAVLAPALRKSKRIYLPGVGLDRTATYCVPVQSYIRRETEVKKPEINISDILPTIAAFTLSCVVSLCISLIASVAYFAIKKQ
jgi:hypothetical protein